MESLQSSPGAEPDGPQLRSDAACSPGNQGVTPAQPGEFAPLQIGPLTIDPPVVLAPMAGVTNAPYRTLCRESSDHRCLYVSEMITARAFVDGHARTLKIASFGADEVDLRSIQLYGTHPGPMGQAARTLVEEWGVHHIDLNFGCPVRKVTGSGGGAAIPVKPKVMAALVRAVVQNAGEVPVTVKFRKGIDDDLLTFRDAGRVAVEEGCQAVALHARTAAQLYSGEADWNAIAELVSLLPQVPVLGNGDIFECWDALRMMRATGCAGVVVGRGCLGRPWLFGELVSVFDGREPPAPPDLSGVVQVLRRHGQLLAEFFGEKNGMRQVRKFCGWYLKGFPGAKRHLDKLHRVATTDELGQRLETLLADLDPSAPFPPDALRARRCKGGRSQDVALPHNYLQSDAMAFPVDDATADEAARHGG